jgi:hypothetical protein
VDIGELSYNEPKLEGDLLEDWVVEDIATKHAMVGCWSYACPYFLKHLRPFLLVLLLAYPELWLVLHDVRTTAPHGKTM